MDEASFRQLSLMAEQTAYHYLPRLTQLAGGWSGG